MLECNLRESAAALWEPRNLRKAVTSVDVLSKRHMTVNIARMTFGSYRLSFDEQQKRVAEASQALRLERIVRVRRQARLFEAEQLQKHKCSETESKALNNRQRRAAQDASRDRMVTALMRQYSREIKDIGRAQKNAESIAQTERSDERKRERQQRIDDRHRHQCFNRAVHLLRKADAEKKRFLVHLLQKREASKRQCREMANKYGASLVTEGRSVSNDEKEWTQSRACQRWTDHAIDFRFSRTHQQLGIADGAYKHLTCKEQGNAMAAAKNEQIRLVATHLRSC